jgi:hypothetical protein
MTFASIKAVKFVQPGSSELGRRSAPVLMLAMFLAAGRAGAGLLGVGVDVGIGGGSGGGLGVGVGVDVGLGGGSGGGLGVGVGVDVGLGGGTSPGNGPGTGPGVKLPDTIPDDVQRRAVARGGSMACAKDGNAVALNGFVVRDRNGTMIGWVHDATVSSNGKVTVVRMQSTGSSCYKLANAGFRISGGEVWANVDASSFR